MASTGELRVSTPSVKKASVGPTYSLNCLALFNCDSLGLDGNKDIRLLGTLTREFDLSILCHLRKLASRFSWLNWRCFLFGWTNGTGRGAVR